MNDDMRDGLRAAAALVLLVVVVIGGVIGVWVIVKTVSRSQKRADAGNRVKVTHILIRNAQQQAQVVHPVGEQGVPLVANVNGDRVGR